jgi:hypothetical protein
MSGGLTKNGKVRHLQRYRCRGCGYNFTPDRRRGASAALKSLAVLLCQFDQAAPTVAAEFGVSVQTIQRWQKEWGGDKWQATEEVRDAYDNMWLVFDLYVEELGHGAARRHLNTAFPKVLSLARKAVMQSVCDHLWSALPASPKKRSTASRNLVNHSA